MQTCKHVHYRGRVQGVGFRMTTKRIAEGFAVTGYVRNLPDGGVEVVASGESGEVAAFLAAVSERMGSLIREQTMADVACDSFSSFEIRI
ncbi:MAG: acylphosphatase [Planctomycetes bacterium]|nr:acylphosphatase [Planctomycetota bacterium]